MLKKQTQPLSATFVKSVTLNLDEYEVGQEISVDIFAAWRKS